MNYLFFDKYIFVRNIKRRFMKIVFKTSKFYPCYPIFIISYYNENQEVQIATSSSSYTLNNTFVLGAGKDSSFSSFIECNSDFSINFLNRNYMAAIEAGGFLSYRRGDAKTNESGLTFAPCNKIDAPYLKESDLVFECRKESIITDSLGFCHHVIARIEERMCEEFLLKDGIFQYSLLDIPLYEGDTYRRVYRFMDNQVVKGGAYLSKKPM